VTECERLEDRFVEVAHGRSAWEPREEAHLAGCAECGAAWRLTIAALELGAGLPRRDVAGISAAVRTRLAAESHQAPVVALAARRRWVRWAAPVAAAAALVLAVGIGQRGGTEPPAAGPAVIVELDDLSAAELELMADRYPEALDVTMPVGVVGMSDLTTAEMELILEAWEG
jgi:hypothetical protein